MARATTFRSQSDLRMSKKLVTGHLQAHWQNGHTLTIPPKLISHKIWRRGTPWPPVIWSDASVVFGAIVPKGKHALRLTSTTTVCFHRSCNQVNPNLHTSFYTLAWVGKFTNPWSWVFFCLTPGKHPSNQLWNAQIPLTLWNLSRVFQWVPEYRRYLGSGFSCPDLCLYAQQFILSELTFRPVHLHFTQYQKFKPVWGARNCYGHVSSGQIIGACYSDSLTCQKKCK